MGTAWRGMLAPLDVSTGDGRRFLSSGVSSRELPLPLKWQRADNEGHENSVIVGSLERIEYGTVQEAIDSGWIDAKCVKKSKFDMGMKASWGFGRMFDDVNPHEMPRLFEDVAESMHLLGQKVIGPSVDTGSCEAAVAVKGSDVPLTDEELDELFWGDNPAEFELELLFTEYQIAAATLVPVPAFQECRPFELLSEEALTAAVRKTGWSDMPLAERDMAWDGVAAEKRVAENANIGGDNPNWDRYAQAFLYQDDAANPNTKGAYGFQIADIVDGTQRIIPRAVFAVAGVLQGARGGTTISEADQAAMKGVVEGIYERMAEVFRDDTIVAPWAEESASIAAGLTAMFANQLIDEALETQDLLTAVTAAAGTTSTYDPRLFDDPGLDRITPITVTEDGRVFGHIATHDTCHVGMPGVCTTAPVSDDGYTMFHRYRPEGIPVPVGRITTGGGKFRCTCRQCAGRNDDHACLKLSLGGAIAHHDQLATVAWVRAGEDTRLNAVWVAGIANPAASVADLAALNRQKVSGDWRPTGGTPELVEVLALAREEPGFPLPRFRIASGQVAVLTAAGVVLPSRSEAAPGMSIDYERLAELLAGRLATHLKPAEAPVAAAEDTVTAAAPSVSETDVNDLLAAVDSAVNTGVAIRINDQLSEVF